MMQSRVRAAPLSLPPLLLLLLLVLVAGSVPAQLIPPVAAEGAAVPSDSLAGDVTSEPPLPAAPSQVHLAHLGESRVAVRWVTGNGTEEGKANVQFDVADAKTGKCPDKLSKNAAASSKHGYPTWTRGVLHEAEIHVPAHPTDRRSVCYRVGSASGGWSKVFKFRDPSVPSSDTVRVLAFGDMGTRDSKAGRPVHVMDALERVPIDSFNMVMLAGDVAYQGLNQSIWDEWFDMVQPIASRVPWMVTVGNHDVMTDGGVGYINRFTFPPNSLGHYWWSVDQGPIHWVAITAEDSDEGSRDEMFQLGSKAYQWLQQDLQAAHARRLAGTGPAWIIVTAHRPMYHSFYRTHPMTEEAEWRRTFHPLFRAYAVDMCLWGHVHGYERMRPVYDRKELWSVEPSLLDKNGALRKCKRSQNGTAAAPLRDAVAPIQIVAGTGGAGGCSKEMIEPQPNWSVTRFTQSLGYGVIDASPNWLNWTYVEVARLDGGAAATEAKPRDAVVLHKTDARRVAQSHTLIGEHHPWHWVHEVDDGKVPERVGYAPFHRGPVIPRVRFANATRFPDPGTVLLRTKVTVPDGPPVSDAFLQLAMEPGVDVYLNDELVFQQSKDAPQLRYQYWNRVVTLSPLLLHKGPLEVKVRLHDPVDQDTLYFDAQLVVKRGGSVVVPEDMLRCPTKPNTPSGMSAAVAIITTTFAVVSIVIACYILPFSRYADLWHQQGQYQALA